MDGAAAVGDGGGGVGAFAWEDDVVAEVRALGGDLGLILGPCGCGKSRLLRRLAFVEALGPEDWEGHLSVVSQVGPSPSEATGRLSSVGLNSIPTWLRPFSSLSNGERQRATLARRLGSGVGIDDFGAEVDARTAASASAAVRKHVARSGFGGVVLATSRFDVLEWLQPDWVVAFTARGARPAVVRNPLAREARSGARRVDARAATLEELQAGPKAYEALADAPRLLTLEDVRPARAPEEGERAGPAPGGRVVALASRVATDGHTAAASAAFDYAHDGTVATRAGKG